MYYFDMGKSLNPKQALFVKLYIENKMNGAQAAIDAGYAVRNARQSANNLLKIPAVRKELNYQLDALMSDTERLAKEWLTEVRTGSMFDIREVLDYGKKGLVLKDFSELPAWAARMITEVTEVIGKDGARGIKVKFVSKEKMLELLGKYLSLLNDNPPPLSNEKQVSIDEAKERIAYLENQERKLQH